MNLPCGANRAVRGSGLELAQDSVQVPAAVTWVAEEAQGVQQHTPEPGGSQCVHWASFFDMPEKTERIRGREGELGWERW